MSAVLAAADSVSVEVAADAEIAVAVAAEEVADANRCDAPQVAELPDSPS